MAMNPEQENVEQSFQVFYEGWLQRQENFLEQLLRISATPNSATKIDRQKTLVDEVLSHYQQYFREKSRVANVDVFLLFCPTWFSSYERASLWIADYKPCLILQLVHGAVDELTEDQKEMLKRLEDETKREEKEVMALMAGVQETVAGPAILRMARWVGRALDGEISELDSAIEMLKRAMIGVLERADELRVSTVRNVVAILDPPQTLQFLTAAAQFQLGVRRWGLDRDSRSRHTGTMLH